MCEHQLIASHTPPTKDLAHNPSMCPDWESNWQPFSLQAGNLPIEPYQPGPNHPERLSTIQPNVKFPLFPWSSRSEGPPRANLNFISGEIHGLLPIKLHWECATFTVPRMAVVVNYIELHSECSHPHVDLSP